MATISYAITANNEKEEVNRLLTILARYKRKDDEVVLQVDESSEIVREENSIIDVYHKFALANDFAKFKNNLKNYCSKDYIFFIDADEYPSEYLLKILSGMLDYNKIDVILVPRVNTVEGITEEDIQKWGWRVNKHGYINYPDLQSRICRNIPEIIWEGKVHEKLIGYKTISQLPFDQPDYVLFHPKTIERQRRQNEYYSTI